MPKITRESLPATLENARRQFEAWRRTRTKLGPIPLALWRIAVEAARDHGVHQVSRVLHLEHLRLKRRLNALAQPASPVVPRPAFVEVSLPPPSQLPECWVEMESPDGRKMRVRLATPEQLTALSGAFWGCRA